MARIKGVDIPNNKRIEISLTYVYGIGRSLSNKILEAANVDKNKRVAELTEEEFWSTIIDFDDNDEKYTVTFELNDPDGTAYIESGRKEYTITRGEYFTASYDMPTVTKPGYRFVGWCTKKEQTPTSGMFTDLTPVFSNLTLYAIWEKIK